MYDESKRFAEALAVSFASRHHVPIRIARIFNTYGPRMDLHDGRAVPAFVKAAFAGTPLPVHGHGTQTRSLCYVDDLVEGILRLLVSGHPTPVNLGSTHEIPIVLLAETIIELVGSPSSITFIERPGDDPERRRPDISLAQSVLDFDPGFELEFGLMRTISWFAESEGFDLTIDLTDRAPVNGTSRSTLPMPTRG
jgi:dTDP-glucose 4,6-dehydratase